jgi:hypothetical protein
MTSPQRLTRTFSSPAAARLSAMAAGGSEDATVSQQYSMRRGSERLEDVSRASHGTSQPK